MNLMRIFLFPSMLAIATLAGCSTSAANRLPMGVAPLSLDQADQIKIGSTLRKEVEALLGMPQTKLSLPLLGREAWLYCEAGPCNQARLTIHLDSRTGIVKSVVWRIQPQDAERDLNVAKARYPQAQLKHQRFLIDYGHYFYTTDSFADPAIGLAVSWRSDRKEVETIARKEVGVVSGEVGPADGAPKVTELPSDKLSASTDR